MDKPNINKQAVYGVIADAMPMEGRDFSLDTSVGPDGNPILHIVPLTDIGKAFVPIIAEKLAPTMKENGGFTVVSGKVEAQEVVTVATIRANVERESNEARKRKLEEAMARTKQASQELKEATEAKNQAKIDSLRKAIPGLIAAEQAVKHANEKMDAVRKELDDAAMAAAEADEKVGKSWAVDFDAPLTTLFDRQDVEEKMKYKERTAQKMAETYTNIDSLRDSATSMLKQYIMPKKVTA